MIVYETGEYDGYVFDNTMFDIKYEILLTEKEKDAEYIYRDFAYGLNKDKIIILLNIISTKKL